MTSVCLFVAGKDVSFQNHKEGVNNREEAPSFLQRRYSCSTPTKQQALPLYCHMGLSLRLYPQNCSLMFP